MYLVDTNVISALAPSNHSRATAVIQWLDRASDDLFLSAVTAAEVHAGIAKAERQKSTAKAERLQAWWQSIEYLYGQKILPFDLRCAHLAGEIIDAARAHQPGFADIAIAATAKAHGLTILTRNIRHFGPLGVPVHDPFQSLPR
ncbi:type II toxin-antitoxin system VapC family toxin [Martelella limonii]|uniref:type II toxin-antitoxin system VapC family toxin n=1 Tax=Martelella limonii TaxID=1647649 RepID=UPI0015806A79|nr:type II toxin-antitoxin system VapC family toxin [Martelella limonii]